jgi:hypothetical protein
MQANGSLPRPGAVLLELFRSPRRALLLCSLVLAASPLAAQTRVTDSAVAGIGLPVAAKDWSADPDGSKAATLDLAASLGGSDCEERELLAWSAADRAAAESLQESTEAAFETAGWSLRPVSRTPEGQRILIARRGDERLVMVWQPEENEVGLLMCRIEPAPLPAVPAPSDDTPGEMAAAAPQSTGRETAPAESPQLPAAEPTGGQPSRIDDAFGPQAPGSAATAETSMTPPVTVEEGGARGAATDSLANLWLRLLAVGLLILGGVGLIVRDIRARSLSVEWQWPTAAGTVERGWVEEDERDEPKGALVKAYMPMLRYRYRVEGEEFQGGNIGLDDRPLPSAEAALRLLSRYPDFATVEVRYDPDDPSFAVLEAPRPPPGREFYFGLGAIVLALAVLIAHLR